MNTYIFYREEGFYPLELKNNKQAIMNAELNPGTLKVDKVGKVENKTIWRAKLIPSGKSEEDMESELEEQKEQLTKSLKNDYTRGRLMGGLARLNPNEKMEMAIGLIEQVFEDEASYLNKEHYALFSSKSPKWSEVISRLSSYSKKVL